MIAACTDRPLERIDAAVRDGTRRAGAHRGPREPHGELGGRRATGRNERVEGGEVKGVGRVDNDLAGEGLRTIGGDDVVNGGVGQGEDDDVTGQGRTDLGDVGTRGAGDLGGVAHQDLSAGTGLDCQTCDR